MVNVFQELVAGWFNIADAVSVVLAVIVTTMSLPAWAATKFNASKASFNVV